MKKIISLLLCILVILPASANLCFIPEGTYVGLALVQEQHGQEKWPFFIVNANGRLTGFYAPENQEHPNGGFFNETDLVSGFTFSVKVGKNPVARPSLVFKPTDPTDSDGLPQGKAKPVVVKNGLGSNFGFYTDSSDNFSQDYLNIGLDGGVTARVTAGRDFAPFFGKIGPAKEFIQIFPDEGNGPRLSISFSGDNADLQVKNLDGTLTSKTFKLRSREQQECSIGEDITGTILVYYFLNQFQNIINAGNSLSKLKGQYAGHGFAAVQDASDIIKNIKKLLKEAPLRCDKGIAKQIDVLKEEVLDDFKNIVSCDRKDLLKEGQSCYTDEEIVFINEIQTAGLYAEAISKSDQDQNDLVDICEVFLLPNID